MPPCCLIMKRTSHYLALFLLAMLLGACLGQSATPAGTPLSPTTTAPPSATATPAVSPTLTPLPPVAVQPVEGLPTGTDGFPWWNDTVFYEVFVRSFYDSNGDGVGDFNGLTAKLDYLNDGDPQTDTDLGVTGLWLMPIHPAMSYHGYNVTDYYQINSQYGTLDDFKRFLAEAHQRGTRVLIDWVPNHTSDAHPWFLAALDPQSEYHDWYVWSDKPHGNAWYRAPNGQYYYGFFYSGMPDLNYTNPAVTAQMRDVARFWLQEVGVDGFRIDAIKYLSEADRSEHSQATHAWLKDFRPFYKALNPQALTVGEVWDSSGLVADYTAGGDELDLGFDFDLARATVFAVGARRNTLFNETLARDLAVFPHQQMAIFLTNHDQDRVMSMLGDDVPRAKLAATLLLTAPGVPFLYYGEEIGMLGKKPDENIRTPMQWSAEAQGGFTTSNFPWHGLNNDYASKNVAAQQANPDSLWATYRNLIRLRAEHAALRVGETYVLDVGKSDTLVAMLRATDDEAVLIVVNLGKEAITNYALTLDNGPLSGQYQIAPLLGAGDFTAPTVTASGGFTDYQPAPELPATSAFIVQFQLKP